MSPYFSGDRIKMVSRVTEKKCLHKNNDFISSFPLAVNIYKANSDDLRSTKRCCKKVKKSVLTLPNEPAPLPQACTVSDMNDSEYFNDDKKDNKPKSKKRRAVKTRRNSLVKNQQIDLYKSNTKEHGHHDADSDKLSKEMFNFTSSNKTSRNKAKKSQNNNVNVKPNFNAHNVWSLLRSANQFKFRPSPPMSEESSLLSIKNKKRKKNKKRSNRKDTRLIETCRTEEFAYISSYVDNSRNSCSQSSFDRITVIEKEEQSRAQIGMDNSDSYSTIPYSPSCHIKYAQEIHRAKQSKSKQCYTKAIHTGKSNDKILEHGMNQTVQNIGERCDENEKPNSNNFQNNTNVFMEINSYKEIDKIPINQSNGFDNHCNVTEKSYSSKRGIKTIKSICTPSKNLLQQLTPNQSQPNISGITKVVLSKGQNILLTKQIVDRKKSRLMTSTPPTTTYPKIKLTLSEIKRRISSIKFPLVILGRDQLNSAITVENYDPPQFAGLSDHIWPFMRIWYDENCHNFYNGPNTKAKYNDKILHNAIKNIHGGIHDQINSFGKCKNNIPQERYSCFPNNVDKLKNSSAQKKPIPKMKNRMLQLMSKKIPEFNASSIEPATKLDVGTNTITQLILPKHETTIKKDLPIKISKPNSAIYSFAKTRKRANEFIENVIRKIKNGVYYGQERKDQFQECRKGTEDLEVQTESDESKSDPVYKNALVEDSIFNRDIDPVISIPGFDNIASENLKLETINNFKMVAVKHPVANIIVQFDIALAFENSRVLRIKQSSSCIPVSLVKNQPTVFKCKKAIINAILPAELCTILPKLMEKIMCSNLPVPSSSVGEANTNISRISEVNNCMTELNKQLIPLCFGPTLKGKYVYDGHFSLPNTFTMKKTNLELYKRRSFSLLNVNSLLITISKNLVPFSQMNLHYFLNNVNETTHKPSPSLSIRGIEVESTVTQDTKRIFISKTVQPYQFSAKKIIPFHHNFSFIRIVLNTLNYENFKLCMSLTLNENSIDKSFVLLNITQLLSTIRNVKIQDIHGLGDNPIRFDKLSTNTELIRSDLNTYYAPKVLTNNMDSKRTSKLDKRKSAVEFCINTTRNKKRGYVKLYKKCKSMSSISQNKCSMNLDKITNLDEFYLALGSGKVLSGVLNGSTGGKVLSSIREMKNWITDITPRQALLVLLLANKKDTSNLVRYRPIILQGIAVNRITRAFELDMEIEVIEKENLNKLTQYEGITYLPVSEEAQDSLLEELYWIAKTTASDYQKPFDASSERHLRSLLEKRKKLNPSYLRVMARYVGLGLLKTSK